MPLFSAKGGLNSASPDTFNPLTGQVLLEYENSHGPFSTKSSTVSRGQPLPDKSCGYAQVRSMNYVTELSDVLRDSNVSQDDKQAVLRTLHDLATKG